MYNLRTLNRITSDAVAASVLKRSVRSHHDILKELSEEQLQNRTVGILNTKLKKAYGSREKAYYHRQVLVDRKLITIHDESFSLTPYGHLMLLHSNLDEIISTRGLDKPDLLVLLELADARTKRRMFTLKPPEISARIGLNLRDVYKSGSRLVDGGLIRSHYAEELSKASQTSYTLTELGREFSRDAICAAITTRIIRNCKPPRWVSLANLMNRRWKYPPSVQTFIERSFMYLTSREPDFDNLCEISFSMFPWLEQVTIDYVLQHHMKEDLADKRDRTGFEINRKLIFTGSETIDDFLKTQGIRVILFALEGLNEPRAKPILENTILLGGMEGPMAYCVVGVGHRYDKAVFESETISSKKLVIDVAKQCKVKDSQIESVSGGHAKYLKVINKEVFENVVFHVKSPFTCVMQSQFQDVRVLKRIPIVLGLFVSAEDETGIDTAIEFAKMIKNSTKMLAKPNVYAHAVLDYVHRLPSIDKAFNQVHVISKLRKCGESTHAEFD